MTNPLHQLIEELESIIVFNSQMHPIGTMGMRISMDMASEVLALLKHQEELVGATELLIREVSDFVMERTWGEGDVHTAGVMAAEQALESHQKLLDNPKNND